MRRGAASSSQVAGLGWGWRGRRGASSGTLSSAAACCRTGRGSSTSLRHYSTSSSSPSSSSSPAKPASTSTTASTTSQAGGGAPLSRLSSTSSAPAAAQAATASSFDTASMAATTRTCGQRQAPSVGFPSSGASSSTWFEEQVRRWDPRVPIERATTPPASWYTSPDIFRREASLVFHSGWQQVCRTEEVAKPGQYFTGELMGEPYVVVRDQQGQLRAFFNVCRHHASKVATGQGCAHELVCPYHGWTYQLDGRLRVAPRVGGIKEFKPKENGLVPMKAVEWGRWVFINIDSAADWSVQDELKPLEDVLETTQYRSLKFMGTQFYRVKSNWKVYVDNYLDGGYHVDVLHKSLSAQLDASQYKTTLYNKWSMQSCPGTNDENQEQLIKDRVGKQGAHYAFIYPNFMINRYGNMMDTNRAIPIKVDETLVQFDYFMVEEPTSPANSVNTTASPPSSVPDSLVSTTVDVQQLPEILASSIRISERIQEEDAWVSQMVQEGLNSRAYDVGRYAPNVEMGAYAFHQLLSADYHRGLSSS